MYFVLFVTSIVFCSALLVRPSASKLSVGLIAIFLIVYLRPISFSGDFESYDIQFNAGVTYSPEPLWRAIVWAANKLKISFLFFQSISTAYFSIYFCKKVSNNICDTISYTAQVNSGLRVMLNLMLVFNTAYLSLMSYRMFLSYSLLFLSLLIIWPWLEAKSSILKHSLLVIAATLIHFSAVAFVPFVFIVSKQINILKNAPNIKLIAQKKSVVSLIVYKISALRVRRFGIRFKLKRLFSIILALTISTVFLILNYSTIAYRLSDYTSGGSYESYNENNISAVIVNILIIALALIAGCTSPNEFNLYPWGAVLIQIGLLIPVIFTNLYSPLVGRLCSFIPYTIVYAIMTSYRLGLPERGTGLQRLVWMAVLSLSVLKYASSLLRLELV